MEKKETFTLCVHSVLQSWTALKLCVEHGMAGVDAALDLVDWIVELFCLNENIDPSDVSLVLADEMDTRFHTLCEDNSTEEIGLLLWRMFQCIKTSDTTNLQLLISQLPSCEPWLQRHCNVQVQNIERNNRDNSSDDEESSMEEDEDKTTTSNLSHTGGNESVPVSSTQDDGWHVVRNKRR